MKELEEKIKQIIGEKTLPQGIEQQIDELYSDLIRIVEENNCGIDEVKKNIFETHNGLQAVLRNLCQSKREYQMNNMDNIINSIKQIKQKVELEIDDKDFDRENAEKGMIDAYVMNESKAVSLADNTIANTVRGVNEIEQQMYDILRKNGVTEEKISKIKGKIQDDVIEFKNNRGNIIFYAWQQDDAELMAEILDVYKTWEQNQNRTEEKEDEQINNKSRRDEFVEGLDGGISLEEQRAFSEKKITEMEKESKQKREEQRGSIEELPDSILE